MNIDLLTQKIKKIAQEISGLTRDIEHNSSRRQFYSDLIKQRVFDLYDIAQDLYEECKEKDKKIEESKERHFLKPHLPSSNFKTEKAEEKKPVQELFDMTPTEKPVEKENAIQNEIQIQDTTPAIDKPAQELEKEDTVNAPSPVNNEPGEEFVMTEDIEKEVIEDEKIEEVIEETKEDITELESTIEESIAENESNQPTTQKVEQNKVSFADNPNAQAGNLQDWLVQVLQEITAKKTLSNDISHKLQSAPITNFYNTVSISQKHQYIDELFEGKQDAYRNTLQRIEDIGNLQATLKYLGNEIAPNFDWKKKEKLVSEFLYLVKRRFL